MRAGSLADRVALTRKPTESQDSTGQPIGTYAPLATVWGQLHPKDGRERFYGRLEVQEIDAVIKIRYRPDMDPSLPEVTSTRATVYGVNYDITGVIDAMDGGAAFRVLFLACKAGVARDG